MFHHPVVIVKGPDSPDDRYNESLEGFTNKQVCQGAVDALQLLEKNPAQVVVIESDLPDMSGVELAEAIRDIDDDRDHFTYIILVGPELDPGDENLFAVAIDVFVDANDPNILKLSARAGARIAAQVNALSEAKASLTQERDQLLLGQLKDPLTGLGNRAFAEQSLANAVRQIESRGGAACYLMIVVDNYASVLAKYDAHIAGELVIAVADRIKALIRPMDIATHLGDGRFALILVQPSITQCTAECYQRIFDGVRLKNYKTSIGFQNVEIGMSICASHAETGAPNPDTMMQVAESKLPLAIEKQTIVVEHLAEQIDG